MPVGFFLTRILYTAKQNAARSIHASPAEKLSVSKFLKFPFDKRKRMPVMQRTSPAIFINPILSFKNILARIIDITGEEVVPISARLIAVV